MVRNPPFNAANTGLIPSQRTAAGQLSLSTRTTEPACHNQRACAPQRKIPNTETDILCAAAKTQSSQIYEENIFKKRK